MTPEYIAVLRQASLFTGIAPANCDKLINCLSPRVKHFAKNEIILMTGDALPHMGIVLTGTASAYLESISGEGTIMSRLTPMSVFGEILVSTRTRKSPVTVYATSDVAAAFIEYDRLFAICRKACTAHREFVENMLKAIGDKYFRLFDRINILRETTLRKKIMAYFHGQAGKGDTITLPFTKTMFAEYLLVNRSALSKELGKMEDDGLIAVNGREIRVCEGMPVRRFMSLS